MRMRIAQVKCFETTLFMISISNTPASELPAYAAASQTLSLRNAALSNTAFAPVRAVSQYA